MAAKKTQRKKTKVADGPTTERWPAAAVATGEFIQLPKVLIKRFAEFGLEPRHLWLILALQVDRYRDRPPRYYWAELAAWCGRSPETVRKWAYDLEEKGLLQIKRTKELNPGDTKRPGHRNERNMFFLSPFEKRVSAAQAKWQKERKQKRKADPD